MITNEKQYRLTRTRLSEFEQALGQAEAGLKSSRLHPKLARAQRDGLRSVVHDLRSELEEYENLKSAELPVISNASFEEFGLALIKARISAGLNQRMLAERLGMKEQQIQRYESDGYQTASYRRLIEIANAIGVRVENNVLVPIPATDLSGVIRKLEQVGLTEEFVFDRLLSSKNRAVALGEVPVEDGSNTTSKLVQVLNRIYGWTADQLANGPPLVPPRFAAAEARFKLPKRSASQKIGLEATYANYLAVAVLQASKSLPVKTLPINPAEIWSRIQNEKGEISLRSALNFVWDHGIPVLPLKGGPGFHGACWRYESRNVIVLKQNTRSEARWLFDLMHEFCHAGQHPELEVLEVVEADETSAERRESQDEIAASRFAGEVLLRGQAEKLVARAVKEAAGSVERLKAVVPRVARAEGVDTGALANYIAFRLSLQKVNWWGAATNLQRSEFDPWEVARDVFVQRFSFELQDSVDKSLLEAALR